jgi:hypothetical protein
MKPYRLRFGRLSTFSFFLSLPLLLEIVFHFMRGHSPRLYRGNVRASRQRLGCALLTIE